MDIFNKKKLAATQAELTCTTASLKSMTATYENLKEAVINFNEQLTEYFRPKYLKKYYRYNDYGKEYLGQVLDLTIEGGRFRFIMLTNTKKEIIVDLSIDDLKNMNIITKKEFKQ
jgi:hypothetical protein